MFESFVQQRKTRRLPWLSVSVLAHALAVAAAWWFMWDIDIVPTSESARVTFFQSMPPPPPPPPPPKRTPRTKQVRKPDLTQQPAVPTEVPPQPKEPEPPEEEPDDGQEGGVEGGVPGGVVGGQLGGQGTGRLEFDGRMTRPKQLSGPPIEYTEKALEHDVEGLMIVRCVLTVTGQVTACQVRQSVRFMDNAVVAALERRRYTPVTLVGSPVPIEVYYTFNIRLNLPR
jgi:periplasmic protein TonB